MASNSSVGSDGAADSVWSHLQPLLTAADGGLRVVGICGAQGSGKSTLASALETRCRAAGIAAATLSLDDLYLTRAERDALARDVHPLLRTRGVPGTHDVALGLSVLNSVGAGKEVRLPRFDKATDDRVPEDAWPRIEPGTRILFLEGWCVGARPQDGEDLHYPINRLEREEDSDGTWRRFVNDALAGSYQTLFSRLDNLVLLAAPNWSLVRAWRSEQERELRRKRGSHAGMSEEAIGRFIDHYERLTRWILAEMPQRADLVLRLAEDRSLLDG